MEEKRRGKRGRDKREEVARKRYVGGLVSEEERRGNRRKRTRK